MDTLKHCPFCGRKMRIRTLHDDLFGDIHVIGHDDDAQILCPLFRGLTWAGSKEELITLWNERPDWQPTEGAFLPVEPVLAFTKQKEVKVLYHSPVNDWWEDDDGYFCENKYITHWMPLPDDPPTVDTDKQP